MNDVKKEGPYPFLRTNLKATPRTGGEAIRYTDPEEKKILPSLEKRNDFDAQRLKRLLALPDLTRKEHSPVKFVVDNILTVPALKGFDVVSIPETVTPEHNFDLFDFPKDHPSRRETDTYFINSNRILRTQTTSMWLYYLTDPYIRKKMERQGWCGLVSFGKVYRKDEIDKKHFPVFHQLDGLYLTKRSERVITLADLQNVLLEIVRAVFGLQVVTRFLDDTFPYTDPSTQMEVKFGDDWLEILGAGLAKGSTLQKLGIDENVWNGWAFGFGVERLAMQKMQISDIRVLWSDNERITKQFTSVHGVYKEISKYPAVIRDISFIVAKDVVPNRFYEIVRELGGDLIEEVQLTDQYENDAKLGKDKKSYTFRIVYRSFERTLTNTKVNNVHHEIEELTKKDLGAVIR